MEFVEAMKLNKRICNFYKEQCKDCILSSYNNTLGDLCETFSMNYPEETERILSKWAEDHPQKTVLIDFLEKYPNAPLNESELPKICLVELGFYDERCPFASDTTDCKECWNRPLED